MMMIFCCLDVVGFVGVVGVVGVDVWYLCLMLIDENCVIEWLMLC